MKNLFAIFYLGPKTENRFKQVFSELRVLILISLLFFGSGELKSITYTLKTANQSTAHIPANWNTDATGNGGGTDAADFLQDGDIFQVISGQNAVIGGSITLGSIAGAGDGVIMNVLSGGNLTIGDTYSITLAVKGSSKITAITVNGTIIFSGTGTNQILTSVTSGSANFTLASGATLRTANTNGISGANCSLVASGSFTSLSLNTAANYEFNGASAQSTLGLPATVNNLTLNNAAGMTLTAGTAVNGTLTQSSGEIAVGSNILTINGSHDAGSNIVSGAGTYLMGSGASLSTTHTSGVNGNITTTTKTFNTNNNFTFNGSSAQVTGTLMPVTINDLTINNAAGVTASGSFASNGVLTLTSSNPSATQGTLEMGAYTLSRDAESATVSGSGEVSGLVTRTHAFSTSTPYQFGNQYCYVNFSLYPSQTLPSSVSIKSTIGTAPVWSGLTHIVSRKFELAATGGSGTHAVFSFNYLDSELASGSDESNFSLWLYNGSTSTDKGFSNYNSTQNWISFSDLDVADLPTTTGSTYQIGIADKGDITLTWNGSISTDWNTSGNWTRNPAGTVLMSESNVVIASGTTYTASVPVGASCKSVIVKAGATLNTVSDATLTLTGFNQVWGVESTGTFNAGNSTVTFDHAVVNEVSSNSGATTFYNLTITTGTKWRVGVDSYVGITGTFTNNGQVAAATYTNTFEYLGSNQTIPEPNGNTPGYHDLIISGSGTPVFPSAGNPLYIAGDLTNNISGLSIPSNVFFTGVDHDNSIKAGQPITFTYVRNSNTSVPARNLNLKVNITTETLILDAGTTLDAEGNTLTVSGTLTNNGTVRFSGASNGLAIGAGTVEYYGTTAQTVTSGTYSTLKVSNTTGASINANMTTENLNVAASGILNINAGKQFTVNTTFTNDGTLNLLSTTTTSTATLLTPSTLSGSGTYHVDQYLIGSGGTPARHWWYISSPVTGELSSIFSPVAQGLTGNKMGYYNEGVTNYVQIQDGNSTLTKGLGYLVYLLNGDATYRFTGPLNNGDVNLTLYRTGTTAGKRGFNMIGNPYPSYLDWNSITKSNVRGTIWYRTITLVGSMQFDTWDGSLGTGNGINGNVTQYIPPLQAFWARVDTDDAGGVQSTGTLGLTNAMRSHQDMSVAANRLRTPANDQMPILRLKVSNGINSDEAIVAKDPRASNEYDSFDADKMPNGDSAIPEIYTFAGNKEIVINHLNNIEDQLELKLGFRPGKSGTFTIRASEFSNFNGYGIFLKDNVINDEREISDGSVYEFSSEATQTNTRFSIIFKATSLTTSLNSPGNTSMYIYENENKYVVVNLNAGLKGDEIISIHNLFGEKLYNASIISASTIIEQSFAPGIYLVEVHSGNKVFIQKITIK